MKITARPSKTFLFAKLEEDLANSSGDYGVDAAPANFKSYPLFQTKHYVGIDLNKNHLKDGKRKHPDGIAIFGDISDVDIVENSVDVIVSTNTLQQIETTSRLQAIRNFCNWVAEGGSMFLEMDMDENHAEIMNIVNGKFENIQIIYYQNTLSRWFENMIGENGRVVISDRSSLYKKIVYMFSFLISFTENFTYRNSKGKKHVYIRCINKLEGKKSPFSLSAFEKDEDDIYLSDRIPDFAKS
jgi:hypothetical protein